MWVIPDDDGDNIPGENLLTTIQIKVDKKNNVSVSFQSEFVKKTINKKIEKKAKCPCWPCFFFNF